MEGTVSQIGLFSRKSILILGALFSFLAPSARAEIEFDDSLMPNERRLLLQDLELLKKLRIDSFELSEAQLQSKTLNDLRNNPSEWIAKRVLILIGPLNRSGLIDPSPNAIMRNLGALLSTDSETKASIIVNHRRVKVTGPDIGVLQFTQYPSSILANRAKSASHLANSIYRLGLLFHDARHSDGSTEQRGIPHSPCPSGHEFAGKALCDRYADASFATEILIGAALIKEYKDRLDSRDLFILNSWIKKRKSLIVSNEIYGN